MEALADLGFQYILIPIAAFLVVSYVISSINGKLKRLPPGPRVWPLLGNIPYLLSSKLKPLDLLSKLSTDYGDIVYLRLLGCDVVVLNDYKVIKEAFHRQDFSKRPFPVYSDVAGRPNFGLVFASDRVAKEQRQFTHALFRSFGVGKRSFEEVIASEVVHLSEEFGHFEGQPFDPHKHLCNAVSNIICAVVFGNRHDYTDPIFNGLLDAVNANLNIDVAFFFFPTLAKIPFTPGYYIRKNAAHVIHHLKRFLDEHRKDFDPSNPRDMIDMYLAKIDEVRETGVVTSFDDTNLLFTLADIFSAASETSATTLRWLLLYMVSRPELQDKIQAEIDSKVGHSRLPNLSDRQDLPFTEATILESLRFNAVAPLGIPHIFTRQDDRRFHGYDIPEGAIIVSNLWNVCRDEKLWKDPDEFRPERFIDEDGKCNKPEEFIPFSIGKRMCIGESLAKMELFLIFSSLLHRFTFKMPRDVTAYSLKGLLGGVYSPEPFQICVCERG